MKSLSVDFRSTARAVVLGVFAGMLAIAGSSVAATPPGDFTHSLDFAVTGYAGANALADYPVLVRLSTAIEGFSYDDVSPEDLVFADSDGNVLPHEVDTWNTLGTSLVWVKVPSLAQGVVFTLYYGGTPPGDAPAATQVWSDYTGVWHLDEDGGENTIVNDSSANAIAGQAWGTGTCRVDGPIGYGRRNSTKDAQNKEIRFDLTSSGRESQLAAVQALGSTFSVSFWMKLNGNCNWCCYVGRKSSHDKDATWGLVSNDTSDQKKLLVYSKTTGSGNASSPTVNGFTGFNGTWRKVDLVYTDKTCSIYCDGAVVWDNQTLKGGAAQQLENTNLALGGWTEHGWGSVKGDFDEFRLRAGALSADWIKADYDNEKTGLVTAGEVVVKTSEPVLKLTVTERGANYFRYRVNVMNVGDDEFDKVALSGGWALTGGTVVPSALTADLVLGDTFEGRAVGLVPNGTYDYSFTAENGAGATGVVNGSVTLTGSVEPGTGGELTLADGAALHVFRASGTLTLPGDVFDARVLVVGGGGSGGGDCGGGGGAGGYVALDGVMIPGGSYAVTVGAGGAKGSQKGMGVNGGDSSFLGYTALGGGGGATWDNNKAVVGRDGGSGGGSLNSSAGGASMQAASGYGVGNVGGGSSEKDVGGGGGGAGSAGSANNDKIGGAGGLGVVNDITGEDVVYAAGGGGGDCQNRIGGAGGSSNVGGHGGSQNVTTVDGVTVGNGCGFPGRDGTGSGGGGSAGGGHGGYGGKGGDGVVIVRYETVSFDVADTKPYLMLGATAFSNGTLTIPYFLAWPGKDKSTCEVTIEYGPDASSLTRVVTVGSDLIGRGTATLSGLDANAACYWRLTANNGSETFSTEVQVFGNGGSDPDDPGDEPGGETEDGEPELDVSRPIAGTPLVVNGIGSPSSFTVTWQKGTQIGSKSNYSTVSSAASYTPTTADYGYWFKCTVTDSTNATKLEKEFYFSKLPVLYLTTDKGLTPSAGKETHNGHVFMQGNGDYKSPYDGAMTIHVRGNSTAQYNKKPWKIKLLDGKTKLFGLEKSKHWVLLANYNDESAMRNKLAADFANEIGSLGMDSTWVECVLNGSWQGLYQLSEHVRIEKNRVDIFNWEDAAEDAAEAVLTAASITDETDIAALGDQMAANLSWVDGGKVTYKSVEYDIAAAWPDYATLDVSGGYLVESSEDETVNGFTTGSGALGGMRLAVNEPEGIKTSDTLWTSCKAFCKELFDASVSIDGRANGRSFGEIADLDSLAAYFLVMEMFGNDDAQKKSRFLYKDCGEPVRFGPVWDFDWGVGNDVVGSEVGDRPTGWKVQNHSMSFYRQWADDPAFCTRLVNIYRAKARAAFARLVAAKGEIDTYKAYLAEAGAANDVKWRRTRGFANGVEQLRTYLANRLAWLDQQFVDVPTLMTSLRSSSSAHPYAADAEALPIAFSNTVSSTIEEGKDLYLSFTLGKAGVASVEVLVNGGLVATVAPADNVIEATISADALSAAVGEENCVSLVAFDGSGNAVARNYAQVIKTAKPEDPLADCLAINEVMASNETTLATPDGVEGLDWVEIYNPGDAAIPLDGWRITDDPDGKASKRKPILGATEVPAGGYLVVFLDKDKADWADGVPHAAIGLSASGESIALVSPDDVVVSRYDFGPQFKDVSFGPGDAPGGIVYFENPTPGAANGDDGKLGPSPKVVFSERHGWKTGPFELTLSCDDPDAKIYYTFDGTSPTTASTEYKTPIAVSQTTVVRARAVVTGGARKPIHEQDYSATYLFAYDIAHQCADKEPPEGFPETKTVNNQAFRYGMRPNIYADNTSHPEIPARLYDGFTNSIRAVSLVIDPANLFNATTGIYVNARNDGVEWERQTMVEQINPLDPADEYSVSCGLRIRGGFSRDASSTKHSFRLFFRSGYGYSKLQHALFGDEGADEFDKIDLRTDQNQTWAKGNSNQETLVHELFSRDSQRDMNLSYHRSQYFHLFINGVYWGIYMYEERCSPEYAASYFGGNEEDYDVFRTQNVNGQYVTGVTDGDPGAVTNFWDEITRKQGYGEGHEANYNRVLGRNPDGSRNPDYPVYLNETNLIGFVLITHYTADTDSPANGGRINNLCSFRNRNDEGGFRFNRHDSEMTFQWSEVKDKGYDNTSYGTREQSCTTFNPLGLHYELCANAEYRTHFVDQVYRHCIRKGGALTRDASLARFGARMAELDSAIVCEGARWGIDIEGKDREQNWMKMSCSGCLNFISNRTDQLIAIYRGRDWYPSIDAPTATKGGETVMDGAVFAEGENLTFANASQGTVYYTLDGSDPRLTGGTRNANALTYTEPFAPPAGVSQLRARILSANGEWSALEEVTVRGASAAGGADPKDAVRVAEVMSSSACADGDADDYLVLTNLADEAVSLANVKIVAWNAKKKSEADPSLTLVFGASDEIAAGGSLKLTAADFAGGKLTNSDVGLRLYDVSGVEPVLFQDCYVSGDWFGGSCDGQGGAFVALEFGAEVKTESQWKSSLEPEVPQGDDVEGDGFLFILAGEYETAQTITPTGAECRVVLNGARIPEGLILDGAAKFTFEPAADTVNELGQILGNEATVKLDGKGTVRLEGPDTLVSVSNLNVKAGVFAVKTTGVTLDKTPVVNVLGYAKQSGGTIDIDLENAGLQAYGIYIANKDLKDALGEKLGLVYGEFGGGVLNATVGGTKSAAVYGNKGSANVTFKSGETVTANLVGAEARFVNSAGKLKLQGGDFTVTSTASDARVFKCDREITVSDGVYQVSATGAGSEIFSTSKNKDGDPSTITISGGTFELVSDDDCFNADDNITVSGGLIYAVSTANDVFDSNGDMTLSGGTILAYALGEGHEAFDVEPMATEDNGIPHVLSVNGGTIFGTGGAGALWPASVTMAEGVNVYRATDLAPADYSEKYISLVGGDAENKTTSAVKLPALAGGTFALFATAPGYDGAAPTVSATAPEKGDKDFHDLYVWSEEIVPATEIIVVGPDGVTNMEEFVSVEDAVTNRPYGSLVEIPVVVGEPLAVTLEPGVKVVFAEGQTFGEGALTFMTPGAWYDVRNEGVEAWIELNDLAKPEFAAEGEAPGEEPIEVGAGDEGEVTLRVTNVRPNLIYGVKASAALSALDAAEPANWTQADGEGHLPDGALTAPKPSPAAGFFTVTVTDDPRVL